jgi:hypothetical protein
VASFITGATGVGTGAHLHFGVLDAETGEYENPGKYEGFLLANGKPLASSFQMTSDFGPRHAPTAGASSNHRGRDYGTPEGTVISFPGSKYLRTWEDAHGGGVVNEYEFIDPSTKRRKIAKMLHGSKENLKNAKAGNAGAGSGGAGPTGAAAAARPGAGAIGSVANRDSTAPVMVPQYDVPQPKGVAPSKTLGAVGQQLINDIMAMDARGDDRDPFGSPDGASSSPEPSGQAPVGPAPSAQIVTKPNSRGALNGVMVGSAAQLERAGRPAPVGAGPVGAEEQIEANIRRARYIRV